MNLLVTASMELQVLQCLQGRKDFTREEQVALYNLQQGYKGEKRLFKLLKGQLKSEHIAIYGLLLNNNGTVFQLDCLLIFPNRLVMLEVKNYQGEFEFKDDRLHRLTNDKYYTNPLHQLQRSEINLQELLSSRMRGIPLESFVTYVHPEFTLFTERNLRILLPLQIKRFIQQFNQNAGKIDKQHHTLAAELISSQMKESPHSQFSNYQVENIRKGILCRNCHSSMRLTNRKFTCNHCSYVESTDSGVLRATIEYHLLFPERPLTTSSITDWCAFILSSRSIRRILQAYLEHRPEGKNAHFLFKDRLATREKSWTAYQEKV